MLLGLLIGAATGAGQDPLVVAAQTRQSQVHSMDIKFHVKEFVAKGSYTAAAAETPGPGRKPGAAIPEQDTTIESDDRLVIDGSKVRFENNHPMWHLPEGKLTQKQTISVSNGELSKVFYPAGVGITTEVVGIIRRDSRANEINTYLLTPLLMHYRGADFTLTPYPAQGLKPTGQRLSIGGRLCEGYQYSLSKDAVIEFWFDTAKGYELKRIRALRRGVPSEQYEIQYQPVSGFESAPMSWVRTEYESGKVRKTTTITVTDCQINPGLDSAEFEITFPPGTLVDDQRVRKEYRVQPSGDMRELDLYGQEVGGSVSQPGTPWWARNKWLLICSAILLLAVVALIVRGRARLRN